MNTCLACKSCVGQCPIKVDVPEFRSKFLALYHLRYPRPLKDYLVASLVCAALGREGAQALQRSDGLWSHQNPAARKVVGFEDGPLLTSINLQQALSAQGIPPRPEPCRPECRAEKPRPLCWCRMPSPVTLKPKW